MCVGRLLPITWPSFLEPPDPLAPEVLQNTLHPVHRRGTYPNIVIFSGIDECQHILGRVLFFLVDDFPTDHPLRRRLANNHFLPRKRLNAHAQRQRMGEWAWQPGPRSVVCSGHAVTISSLLSCRAVPVRAFLPSKTSRQPTQVASGSAFRLLSVPGNSVRIGSRCAEQWWFIRLCKPVHCCLEDGHGPGEKKPNVGGSIHLLSLRRTRSKGQKLMGTVCWHLRDHLETRTSWRKERLNARSRM